MRSTGECAKTSEGGWAGDRTLDFSLTFECTDIEKVKMVHEHHPLVEIGWIITFFLKSTDNFAIFTFSMSVHSNVTLKAYFNRY